MLYRTHKAGGTLAGLIGFEILRQKGLLVPNINEFVQLAIMYPSISWGSTWSDLDHCWENVKEKTPINALMHKVLHLTHPRHRSWQTHSILVTGGFCFLLFAMLSLATALWGTQFPIELSIIRLWVIGFTLGVASHLVLDSLSTGAIYTIPGHKLRLVPKSPAFATGGTWENIVFYTLMTAIVVVIVNLICRQYNIDFLGFIFNHLKS